MTQLTPIAPIHVPRELRIESDMLVIPESSAAPPRMPQPDILDRFCEIDSAESVLSFARRNGLLFADSEPQDGAFREKLSDWYGLVWRFNAIRNAAGYLNAGELPPDNVVRSLCGESRFARRVRKQRDSNTIMMLRMQVAFAVSKLMYDSGLRPQIRWDLERQRWVLTLASMPSFGVVLGCDSCLPELVWRLAFEVMNSPGSAFCSLCGGRYTPERAPSQGRGNYCGTCRTNGRMWRHLKRIQREKAASQIGGKSRDTTAHGKGRKQQYGKTRKQ
jgi:hypothetical protein